MKGIDDIHLENEISEGHTLSLFTDVDKSSIEEQILVRYKMNTEYRKKFSEWVIYIIPIWLGLVLFVFVLHGARLLRFESAEIVALLATTTANVLGLAFIVLRGFFGNRE